MERSVEAFVYPYDRGPFRWSVEPTLVGGGRAEEDGALQLATASAAMGSSAALALLNSGA